MQTVTLTEANDTDFDAEALGVDLKKLSNVQVYCVTKVRERVKEGFLHYVNLEFTDGEIGNPISDPLIFCTLVKREEDNTTTHCEIRAIWNNKLWRILDDSAGDLLELLSGIKKSDVGDFVKKLFDNNLMQEWQQDLVIDRLQDTVCQWKPLD